MDQFYAYVHCWLEIDALIIHFIQLLYYVNISFSLMLLRLSFFFIHSMFGLKLFSLYDASLFAFIFWLSKSYSRHFRYFLLTFGIEHCIRIYFMIVIFRMGSSIKSSYGISTTHALWYPITDYSGWNIAAWQLISFVSQMSSIYFFLWSVLLVPFTLSFT